MSDLMGLDLLGNLTTKTIDVMCEIVPAYSKLKPHAIDMEFLYISSSLELGWTTPDTLIKPTHTYADAPRDLDILLLGGPDPGKVHEESLTFLREASKQTKVILTTCTGGMWLARSGVLDGKKATTNRGCLEMSKKMFPRVEWLDQRWVVADGHFDGAQIWTAGGAGCGKTSPSFFPLFLFSSPGFHSPEVGNGACIYVCVADQGTRNRHVHRIHVSQFQPQDSGTWMRRARL